MAKFDEAEFKRVVSTTKVAQARQAPGRTGSFHRASISKNRRAAGKMLESFLTKSGLDVGLAQDQRETRGLFKKQIANADFSGAQAAYRQGIEAESNSDRTARKPLCVHVAHLGQAVLDQRGAPF
jgi:hypothetical protein